MSNPSSKKVAALVQSPNQELQFVFARAKHLQALNQLLLQTLPSQLRDHCQLANLADRRLTILVANGSIATQLRWQTADILQQLRQHPPFQHIQELQLKVRPNPLTAVTAEAPPRRVTALTPETARIVAEIAEGIDHPGLKAALQRIASHVKK